MPLAQNQHQIHAQIQLQTYEINTNLTFTCTNKGQIYIEGTNKAGMSKLFS